MDTHRTIPTPAVMARPRPAAPAAFPRAAYERAVLSSTLHGNARLVALTLAICASDTGHLAAGGPQRPERLAELAGINTRQARISLHILELARFIERPSLDDWTDRFTARPVKLTFPPAEPTPSGHPGGAEE